MIEYSFQLPDLCSEYHVNLAIVSDWLRNDTLIAWCDTRLADKLGIGWDTSGTSLFLLGVSFEERAEKNVGCVRNGNTGSVTTSVLTFRFQQMFKPSK